MASNGQMKMTKYYGHFSKKKLLLTNYQNYLTVVNEPLNYDFSILNRIRDRLLKKTEVKNISRRSV